MNRRIVHVCAWILFFVPVALPGQTPDAARRTYSHGAIVRLDTTQRVIHLAFTGHDFAGDGERIRAILKSRDLKANFFFTGDFYRNPEFQSLIDGLRSDGHYLGPHSDRHLLYCPWTNRDSLLVTKEEFLRDIGSNFSAMRAFGIVRDSGAAFMPPYEWYNDTVAAWCREAHLTLVNFTPGTSSNADYTYPELGRQYVSSDTIFQRILREESASRTGLNGFILLLHIGTDPRRTDPFAARLGELLDELLRRGYSFRRW